MAEETKKPQESPPSPNPPKKPWIQINPPVFFGAAIVTIALIIFTFIDAERAEQFFEGLNDTIKNNFGWFYIASVAVFLVFIVYLGVSRLGLIRLGPDHSEPDYSYATWFAMLFSAGMGIGLMFFGVAEPVSHYISPPEGDPETVEAAREAMRITFFHWGVHAWAIYAVVALSLAYFAFRHNLPLTIRSAFYPLIGERIYGPIGHTIDTFAVLGTIFGVATSLGVGVTQIGAGLEYLFGWDNSTILQVVLIAVITAIATLSVALGLDTGIRRISELNIILAIVLVLFVLIAGPTVFLMESLVQNTGAYIASLFEQTFHLYAYESEITWIDDWTLLYWGWWIAWAPFVGMFIARVSRGRTIREFVVGVLFVPVGFTFLWMTAFGDTAIHLMLFEGVTSLGEVVGEDESKAIFVFFEYLPLTTLFSTLATLLVITFFVTSSDSGSLVVDMLTSGGEGQSPLWQRIFWAIIEGVVAASLLLAGGLAALQAGAVASALPFTLIMLFMCLGLYKAVRLETVKKLTLKEAWTRSPGASGGGSKLSWKQRLSTLIRHPKKAEVMEFLQTRARPALEEVAEELRKKDLEPEVDAGEDGRVWILVPQGNETDFYYSVRPRSYEPPAFILDDTRADRMEKLKFYRAEVHLKEGGQNYDIMGLSKDEIINDVIDHYEKHLAFLQNIR
ncbi:MAG: choline BCCT transporter BetT [Opitutales bacterium]|nr:choline BCCT transporter BetT [Opitutales bacterium]